MIKGLLRRLLGKPDPKFVEWCRSVEKKPTEAKEAPLAQADSSAIANELQQAKQKREDWAEISIKRIEDSLAANQRVLVNINDNPKDAVFTFSGDIASYEAYIERLQIQRNILGNFSLTNVSIKKLLLSGTSGVKRRQTLINCNVSELQIQELGNSGKQVIRDFRSYSKPLFNDPHRALYPCRKAPV